MTFTRPGQEDRGHGYGPRLRLEGFDSLTTLRIYHVFFIDRREPYQPGESPLRNLEILDVYYDDPDLYSLKIDLGPLDNPPILGLAQQKTKYFPRLRKVTVISPEDVYYFPGMKTGPGPL